MVIFFTHLHRYIDAPTKILFTLVFPLFLLLSNLQDIYIFIHAVIIPLYSTQYGHTPLMYAAAVGNEEYVQLLLGAGAHKGAKNKVTAYRACSRMTVLNYSHVCDLIKHSRVPHSQFPHGFARILRINYF